MKLNSTVTLFLGMLALVAASRADQGTQAQPEADDQVKIKKFAFSVGAFLPRGRDAKDAGTVQAMTRLSYDLNPTGNRQLSYGLFTESNSRKKDGNEFTVGSIGIQGRLRLRPLESGSSPYLHVSLGAYSVKYTPNIGAETDEMVLGGQFGFGFETRGGLFAEAGYRWTKLAKGVDASGVTLAIGIRF